MKQIILVVLLAGMLIVSSGCETDAQKGENMKLETEKDSISYFIGTDISRSLKGIKEEINLDLLVKGMQDALDEKPLLVTAEEMHTTMAAFTKRMQQKQEEKNNLASSENIEKGQKFLEENKKKEGVVTTASGLQYTVLTQGKGPKPSDKDKVKVHYRGTNIDGEEFDSSYKRGEPTTFPVTGVIKGWTEALQLMNVGSKYKLFVPSDLAYGPRGAGQNIGPNEVLVFEVELLEIVK